MPFRVLDPDYKTRALSEIYRSALRGGILKHFTYRVTLPLLLHSAEDPLPCHEPMHETTLISVHVSARLHSFYKQLADYYTTNPEKVPDGISISLCIMPQSIREDPYCSHRKYHSRRLQLHDPATLEDLPFVSSLTVESKPDYGGYWESEAVRPLSPLVPLQCLIHLPAVEALKVPWMWERPMPCSMPSRVMRDHYTWPWEGPLRDARHEFGAAVLDPQRYLGGRKFPESLTKAALYFWGPRQTPHEDQAVPRPNLISPWDKDPVSLGLCRLATQLHIFDVRALITEDLFPRPKASAEGQWSKMRRLRIEFHPLRPDGRWYFIGPRGEDPHDSKAGGFTISESEHYPREYDIEEDEELDEEWGDDPSGGEECDTKPDLFRTEPCQERIEPLLVAFARALTRTNMPRLEIAEIFAYVWWHPSRSRAAEYGADPEEAVDTKVHRWGVKYVAERGGESGDAVAPTVQWQVGDWRPSQEVLDIFEGLGQQEWLDVEHSDGRSWGTIAMEAYQNCLF